MDAQTQLARIARAMTAVGIDDFPECLTTLLQTAFRFDSLFVSVFTQDHTPPGSYFSIWMTMRRGGPSGRI